MRERGREEEGEDLEPGSMVKKKFPVACRSRTALSPFSLRSAVGTVRACVRSHRWSAEKGGVGEGKMGDVRDLCLAEDGASDHVEEDVGCDGGSGRGEEGDIAETPGALGRVRRRGSGFDERKVVPPVRPSMGQKAAITLRF